jgi:hypothetical protein
MFVLLLAAWTAGVVTGDLFGGALHLLLLCAVIVLFVDAVNSSRQAQN